MIDKQRQAAKHGDFFFAKFLLTNDHNSPRQSPVFVISNDNDKDDIIVCKCTGQAAKTDFDVKVQLKNTTHVRTNKIHTISRSQLLFKIEHKFQPEEYEAIIQKLKMALNL